MRDDLGDRMKGNYEDRTRYSLPRRTYTIIRLDGKAFHTYTRGLKKPFDFDLFTDIDNAIIAMLADVQGAVFAYTQSDEISILLTDFATPQTSAWFDGNLQKVATIAASKMTAKFNRERYARYIWDHNDKGITMVTGNCEGGWNFINECRDGEFDARVFTIPDRIEVMNYFIWRNQDCARNSVSMVAQENFSHKELQGKSTPEMHEMLHHKGINWATDFPDGAKNGRLIVKESYETSVSVPDVANFKVVPQTVTRTRWVSKGAWKFTEDKEKLLAMIPAYA